MIDYVYIFRKGYDGCLVQRSKNGDDGEKEWADSIKKMHFLQSE